MKRLTMLLAFLFFISSIPAIASSVKFMEKEELKPLLESDSVVILDVRTGRDWSTSEFKIPGAIRASSSEFDGWSETHQKDKKIVLYCA